MESLNMQVFMQIHISRTVFQLLFCYAMKILTVPIITMNIIKVLLKPVKLFYFRFLIALVLLAFLLKLSWRNLRRVPLLQNRTLLSFEVDLLFNRKLS